MKKINVFALIMIAFLSVAPMAQAENRPVLTANTPEITAITSTSATVSVPQGIISTLTDDQRAGMYFEYIPTNQVCIAIYPTPESCLPKKTAQGQLSVTLTGLKPSTAYTVSYKKDNTIACFTTPCPGNGVASSAAEFTTLTSGTVTPSSYTFTRTLFVGTRGTEVTMLQDVLRTQGYFSVSSNGYFGLQTRRAVMAFQRNYMYIVPTGIVAARTRAALNGLSVTANAGEYFSGTIQAVSTGCYADGICSMTIDGKVVVTTIGWTSGALGTIKGTVSNIGDAQAKIGSRANVYAAKTSTGYTLYGNTAYYIDVQ